MSDQFNGWGGGALASVAALMHGDFLGGLAVVVVVLAIAIKTAGPELREWVTMMWARKDAKEAELVQGAAVNADDEMPDAA